MAAIPLPLGYIAPNIEDKYILLKSAVAFQVLGG